MEMVFIIGMLFLLLGLAFDLGRKWERMEWDGSFDEQEAAQQSVQPTLLAHCHYCNREHDSRLACPEYAAKSQSG